MRIPFFCGSVVLLAVAAWLQSVHSLACIVTVGSPVARIEVVPTVPEMP